uniref:Ig-like domain-containing protein n=1 Tax=Xenopus tropicalis TaxID=8364 RepID=A0A6I8SQH9_XENTR
MLSSRFLSTIQLYSYIPVCICFIYLSAFRPVISFSPNWTPIFTGESVTLSCNVAPTAQGNLGYSWYRDGQRIPGDQQSLVIQPAKVTDSGDYQCQAGASERSDSIRLDVNSNWLILQAPPAVYEGDSLSLRCHSWSGYDTRKPVFYKDNKAIGSPVSGSELQIGRVGVTASGTYRCEKKKSSSDGKYILVSGETQLKANILLFANIRLWKKTRLGYSTTGLDMHLSLLSAMLGFIYSIRTTRDEGIFSPGMDSQ